MDASSPAPDAERESSPQDPPRSLWRRLTATRARRLALVGGVLVAGALVAAPTLANTLARLVGPPPDATLRTIPDEADGVVFSLLQFLGANPDPSSPRGYQEYSGFEPWYFEEEQGFQCLMLVARSTNSVDGANCVPPGLDLFADVGAWPPREEGFLRGLPDGSIVRFHYRGDSVDVFVYPASEAD